MNKLRVCKHCGKEFDLPSRVFSNHVRWCEKNPARESYKNVIRKKNKTVIDERLGEVKEHTKSCKKCGKEYTVTCREAHLNNSKHVAQYCSRTCRNTRNHSEETKNKIRSGILNYNYSDPNYKKPICKKLCLNCGSLVKKTKRTFCSVKCANEHRVKSIDLESLSAYRHACKFKFSLKSFKDEFDFSLIEAHGWYSAANHGNNLNGVSRDHIVSVRFGFDNKIDPSIISHPANCQLLLHSENASKHKSCGMTIEQLLEKIRLWDLKYPV